MYIWRYLTSGKKNIYLRFWSLIPKPSNETGSPNPSEVGFTAVGFAPMASWLGMLHPHIRKHMALWKETHHTTEVYNMVADSVMNQASWQGQMDANFGDVSHGRAFGNILSRVYLIHLKGWKCSSCSYSAVLGNSLRIGLSPHATWWTLITISWLGSW